LNGGEMNLEKARTCSGKRLCVVIVVMLLGLSGMLVLGGCGSVKPVVKKVDHITISSTDAPGLFNFFTQELGLPVAWPLAEYPGFTTGGAQAGNVNIESLHLGMSSAPATASAGIYGIVFEPYPLSEVTSVLTARGAEPAKPQPQQSVIDGKQVTLYTTVTLKTLCTDDYIVYLCEYSPEAKARLASRGSGDKPLGNIGLESVREIDITAMDVEATRDQWKKVLAPASMTDGGLMTVGSGPAVRIVKGNADRITGLVFEVASLKNAEAYLQQKTLLGEATARQAKIDPSKVQGLNIILVQK